MCATRRNIDNDRQASSDVYRKIALVIGNGLYHRNSKLENPVNDANDMSNALQSIGFKVSKGINLTCNQMQSSVNKFIDSIQSTDLALFYFAGHGTQWEDQNFLVPCDDENLSGENITRYAINAQHVLKHMSDRKPFATVFLLDCCRTYWLRSSGLSRGSGSETRGLAPMYATGNTFLSFACAPNQTSSDGNRIDKNGTFTKHLLRYIKKPNEQLQDLMIDVNRAVVSETGGAQVPWQHMSLTHRDIYLAHNVGGNSNDKNDINEGSDDADRSDEDTRINHQHTFSTQSPDAFFSKPMQGFPPRNNVQVKHSFHFSSSGYNNSSGRYHREFHGETDGGDGNSLIKQAERDLQWDIDGDGRIG
ncbi:hypothetical protein I4U23_015854 [Adineta vaga]|nr:hypothetical protein I4U23_015854 [Adineta vaga]